MESALSFIDLGSLAAFRRRLTALQKRVSERLFRFHELPEQKGFWLFEDEDDEEILGGVLRVHEGRVYAISQDVANLVDASFLR